MIKVGRRKMARGNSVTDVRHACVVVTASYIRKIFPDTHEFEKRFLRQQPDDGRRVKGKQRRSEIDS